MKHRGWLAAAIVLCWGSAAAAAAPFPGYANTLADLRTGPGENFPVITHVLAEVPLEIKGCTAEFKWCEIDWRGTRGWVDGRFLDSIYKGARVRVKQYCIPGELPIIHFDQNTPDSRHR